MKVKTYTVRPIKNPKIYYFVDAPNKGIAKWCGANMYNNDYATSLLAKDMRVKRFIYNEVKQDD